VKYKSVPKKSPGFRVEGELNLQPGNGWRCHLFVMRICRVCDLQGEVLRWESRIIKVDQVKIWRLQVTYL
jgi:hypothetical protein